ncbi:AraC family transcriptional regulator [Pseudomonas sp. NPDC089554]|uniref:AraC family transcriptional regulator n=1 Tax=Pseudomonas sp. NPDC089554 TaxID=3390653 RepID=UPI003CFBFA44
MPTLRTANFELMLEAISQQGLTLEEYKPGATAAIEQAGEFIALERVYDVLRWAAKALDNPDIGLLAYRHAHTGSLNAAGYAIMSSATLGDALERLVEYHPLTSNGSELSLERQAGSVMLMGIELGCPAPRPFIDAGAALILGLIHWLVPAAQAMPLRVQFSYPRPNDLSALEQLFGKHLSFSAPCSALVFADSILSLPLKTASPALEAIHRQYANAQLRTQLDSMSKRIERLVHRYLHKSMPLTLELAAEALGSTRRSLQSALEAEGASFRALLDEERKYHAHQMLHYSELTVKTIASRLGYYEISSFHKSCHRWFGMTPSRYREQCLGAGPHA